PFRRRRKRAADHPLGRAGIRGEAMNEQAARLLIVEDDASFARTLQKSFERRGYAVTHVSKPDDLTRLLEHAEPFRFAVVDLKLGTASGLICVEALHKADPATRIVVLTGFASI